MDAFFCLPPVLLNLPMFVLHGRNLHRHPRMASAGMLANAALVWKLGRCHHPNDGLASFLMVIHKLSLAEFLYSFCKLLQHDHLARPLKYAVGLAIVFSFPISDLLLYLYAVYVASFAPSFVFHVYYLFFLGLTHVVETPRLLVHLCMFFLMTSAYQMAELNLFIQEQENDAG